MTQPSEAVGGASDTVVAAEPTITDRFAAITEAEEPRKKPEEAAAPEGTEALPELTADDVPEQEAEAPEESEAQPIKPPVSWAAEAQEEFKNLPPELQKVVAQREAEREKFVQSKSQEAVRIKADTEREAFHALKQIKETAAQELQRYAAMFEVQPVQAPHPALNDPASPHYNPDEYTAQSYAHWQYQQHSAHRETAERQAAEFQQQAQWAEAEATKREQQQTFERLTTEFPEYLDATKGPDLQRKLGATALEIGFSADQLPKANGDDIMKLKLITDWRDKAAKYDKLIGQKMERVRSAKDLPRVSRPGTAQGRGVAEGQRYEADRQAMRAGDKDAGSRVFARFL